VALQNSKQRIYHSDLSKNTFDALSDRFDAAMGFHRLQQTPLSVMLNQRLGFVCINHESIADYGFVVVVSPPRQQAFDQDGVIQFKKHDGFDGLVELLEERIERFSLGNIAWESIQQPSLTIQGSKLGFHDGEYERVAHQLSTIHHGFGFFAQFGSRRHLRAKKIASGEVT
jgi:hypothetical protein